MATRLQSVHQTISGNGTVNPFTATTETIISSIAVYGATGGTHTFQIQKSGSSPLDVFKAPTSDGELLTAPFTLENGDAIKIVTTSYTSDSQVFISYAYNSESYAGESIDVLNDVDTTGKTDGDILSWNATSGEWEPIANTGGGGGATALNGLTDVTVSTPIAGHGLWYDGSNFVNRKGYADDMQISSSDATNVATQINTNETNIATNAGNISTNTSNISTNTSDISTNTSNISTNTGNISTNTSNISTNTSNISTNASDITAIETKTDFITVTQAVDLDAMETGISDNETDIANIELKTDWITVTQAVDLDTMESDISTNATDITNIETKTNHITVTQAVDLDTMESDISTNATNIGFNTTAITGTASALSTHEASVGNHTDVTLTTPVTGNLLEYNGTAWVNVAAKTYSIDDLTDVDTTTTAPTTNQVLKWDGSNWSPADDSTSGGGGGSDSFNTISVSGQTDVVADSGNDTLTLAEGTGIEITTNATTDTITFGLNANLNDLTDVDALATDHLGMYYNSTSGEWEAGTGNIDMEHNTASGLGSYARGATTLQLATSQTLTAGNLVVNPTGSGLSDADANSSDATRLLSVVSTTTDGTKQVIYGCVKVNTSLSTDKAGDPVYVSETAGEVTTTAPTTSGAFVRVVGHVVDPSRDVILFNPSNDWIELE